MSEPFVGVDEMPRHRNGRPVHDQNPPELGGTHPCWQDDYSAGLHRDHDGYTCRDCGCCTADRLRAALTTARPTTGEADTREAR